MTVDREEYDLHQFKVDLVEKQLARIEKGAEVILAEMGCSADPVQIYAILVGEQQAPWTKQTAERAKRRAKYAMHVLLQIAKVRSSLGPARPDAPMSADSALTVGWLAAQLGLELRAKARATRAGHAPKRKATRSAAQRHRTLRRKAEKLPPTLSATAKAKILARTSKLSADRIRRIIE